MGGGVGGGGGVCGVLLCGQWATECGDSEDCGDGEEDGEDELVERMLLKNSYKLSDEGAVARWPDGG